MRKTADDRNRHTLKGRLRQHSVELAVLVLSIFVIYRILVPLAEGEASFNREQRVVQLLREIHKAQVKVAAEGGERLLWLDELIRQSKPGTLLREAQSSTAPEAPEVDLISLDGYYVALNLTDTGREDDRAWSRSLSVADDVGTEGYSAFGWPVEYGPGYQWVFYIDGRGKLMGSWNHLGEFDGLKEPFPPQAQPLRDYLTAEKDGKDASWFQFKSMPEVRFPDPPELPEDG